LNQCLLTVESLEQDLSDQFLNSEALRQFILKKAFSGQLVPQDPDDEPASALLARIAKEKEQACLRATHRQAAAKEKRAKAAKKKVKQGSAV